jgi:hypothetical protein
MEPLLEFSSPLYLWHFELVCVFGQTEAFQGASFCDWVETRVPCERALSLALGQCLVDGFYMRVISHGQRVFNENATCKVTDVLLDNPFRMQQVFTALDASQELQYVIMDAACQMGDIELSMAMLHFICSSSSSGYKALTEFCNGYLSSRRYHESNDRQEGGNTKFETVFIGVLRIVLPDLRTHVMESAELINESPDHFVVTENNVFLARANLLNVIEFIVSMSNLVASEVTKCTDAGLVVLTALHKHVTLLGKGKVEAFKLFENSLKRVLLNAWRDGTKSMGPKTGYEGSILRLGQLACDAICIPELPTPELASLFSCLAARDGDLESVMSRLKGPHTIVQSIFQDSFGNKAVPLTARRAALSTSIVLLPSSKALVGLVVAMINQGSALVVSEKADTLRGNMLGAVLMHDIFQTILLAGIYQKREIKAIPVKQARAISSLVTKGHERVHRERSLSLPHAPFLSIGSRRLSVVNVETVSERTCLTPLDASQYQRWNPPWCGFCCIHATFEDDKCPSCHQPFYRVKHASELLCLFQLIGDHVYEVGTHCVLGDVQQLRIPSKDLFISWCASVGPHVLEIVHHTGSLFLYASVGGDTPDAIVCVVPDSSHISSSEMVFVLSASEGFTRYRRTSSVNGLLPRMLLHKTMMPILDTSMVQQFRQFLSGNAQLNFKFGVLYQSQGQVEEHAMYANNDGSLQYEDFLTLLGQRVSLAFHTGYSGGLGRSDESSIFQQLCMQLRSGHVVMDDEPSASATTLSIMWHIATMMRIVEDTKEYLHRKRHVGNDVVVVIFRDWGTTTKFEPSFRSNFNHVFIVIQPAILDSNGRATSYYLQVAAKKDVAPFPPFIPCFPLFKPIPRAELATFLAVKCINGEVAALQSPAFAARLSIARRAFIEGFIDNVLKHPKQKH